MSKKKKKAKKKKFKFIKIKKKDKSCYNCINWNLYYCEEFEETPPLKVVDKGCKWYEKNKYMCF